MTREKKYKIIWKTDNKKFSAEEIISIENSIFRSSGSKDKDSSSSLNTPECKINFKTFPSRQIIEINYIAKYKFFHWKKNFSQNENVLFINAESDFESYLILDFMSGLLIGTSIWLIPQSIEKYLKALLVKSKTFTIKELSKYENGHNLIVLLEKYKTINSKSVLFQNKDYETLISEVDSDGKNTGIRYSAGIFTKGTFTRTFIEICIILRSDFKDSEKLTIDQLFRLENKGKKVEEALRATYHKYRISDDFIDKVLSNR